MLVKSKEFGIVYGRPGVKYFQNGKYYNHDENEVTEHGILIPSTEKLPETNIIDTPVDETLTPAKNIIDADDVPLEDLEALPYQEIKRRVEGMGGVWTNKIEGIAYLRGL